MFEPNKLIGRKIYFQCEDRSTPAVVLEILSVKKHYEAVAIHKGRVDLVIYETNKGEFSLEYQEICDLIEKGEHRGKSIKCELKLLQ